MHLVVFVDDRDGLSFCGRRLSQDRLLNEHLLRLAQGSALWMSPYSGKMFSEDGVHTHEDFQKKAGVGEYCLVETAPLLPDYENLESVILYHWNRTYPSTVRFPRNLLAGMKLVEIQEFPGSSHEKITMERYTL